MMDDAPQRVLVVIPHPGDAEVWCAGSLAQWIQGGAAVRYVVCTDGGKGTADPSLSSGDLAAAREREQAAAAQGLGVREVVSLGRPDGGLEDTDDFRRELVRQIRQMRPEVVVCPEPYRKNLAWHRDSRIAGQVTLDAVFPCARDHLHFEELWRDEGLEPHKTGTVLFWGTETPDTFIDIGAWLEAKGRAVKAGQTRLTGRDEGEIDAFIRRQARESAGDSGAEYGEAFRKITFRT